jgi:hypothetical protein
MPGDDGVGAEQVHRTHRSDAGHGGGAAPPGPEPAATPGGAS